MTIEADFGLVDPEVSPPQWYSMRGTYVPRMGKLFETGIIRRRRMHADRDAVGVRPLDDFTGTCYRF